MALVQIPGQPQLGRRPGGLFPRQGTGNRDIGGEEPAQPAEVFSRLIRGHRDQRKLIRELLNELRVAMLGESLGTG